MFRPVDPKTHLPEIEHKHIEYWKRKNIFMRSVENRKGKEKFVFFDGPPFANGLPHYGHILAQSLKDAVTRYATMRGYYVPRTNGWDCHGLPVEYEIEKELGLSGRNQIEEFGIENFNAKCRESVFRYTKEWESLLDRIARWVDLNETYATLDSDYMESIWWVFKEIWKKGLVYESFKSMHVCPRCATPLSNFEVSLGYKDVTDLSVVAKFKSKKEKNTYFLAWTTTPWTLPGNVALAVNENINYVKVKQGSDFYILAKELLPKYFDLNTIEIEEEILGKNLIGQEYQPLFDYYAGKELEGLANSYKIYAADFVDIETGTGIVHIAGGYGEDDLNLVLKNKIALIQHVDINGNFKEEVKDFAGKFVKGQDQNIADYLEERLLLFKRENIRHSYPHCWRCDTPLLNYASKSWFIKVTEIKDKLIANNNKIHWQPEHLKEGRFGKWLEQVRDWNISRNRFWGCPIPVWRCEKCGQTECIGSMTELKEKSGILPLNNGVVDLHKPYIDEIKFPCSNCKSNMIRIPDVLDCWFESGSMPYAQLHYPFENKEEFEKNFPAIFIAEGLDQTRGWFYTLHVLATILFDKPAFQNVIVNGILLAADGEKLSKRKKNYPDPNQLFEEKGVDTTRMFLYSSTAPLAEDVRFSEKHVEELQKKFTLTLWNTYSFFVTYANIDNFKYDPDATQSKNILDQWILSELNNLIQKVTKEMDDYNLTKATRPMMDFIDNLSNWYIRRSRRRFWKSENDEDKKYAYQSLYAVLLNFSKILAPFMPFLSDEIYRNLTEGESVHLLDWPVVNNTQIDKKLNEEIGLARLIVNLGHAVRSKKKIKVRQPLSKIELVLPKNIDKKIVENQKEVIMEELNVKELVLIDDPKEIAELCLLPNAKVLGPKFGSKVQDIIKAAKAGKYDIKENNNVEIAGLTLESGDFDLIYKGKEGYDVESQNGILVSLNTEVSEALLKEGLARELIRYIQDMRKEADYNVSDRISTLISTEGLLELAVTEFAGTIKAETLSIELRQSGDMDYDLEKIVELDEFHVKIAVKRI